MTIDIFPTIARLIGGKLPSQQIDGLDIWPVLAGEEGAKNPHGAYFFYFAQNELQAARSGPWKLILPTYRTLGGHPAGRDGVPAKYGQVKLTRAELYNIEDDLGETTNVADLHPEIVKELQAFAEQARDDLGDSLTKRKGAGVREPGRLD